MKHLAVVTVALCLMVTPATAAYIYVGDYDWNVSQPTIDIPVYISGGDTITAISLAFSVGDGGPLLSGSETISFTDIAPHAGVAPAGTIWAGKSIINDIGYDLPSPGAEVANMAIDGTSTVTANGMFAIITLQAPSEGLANRIGEHLLLDVNAGASSGVYNGVSTVDVSFGTGTLTLVPEPSTIVLSGIAALALLVYRGVRRRG